jgi:hypothetical protein
VPDGSKIRDRFFESSGRRSRIGRGTTQEVVEFDRYLPFVVVREDFDVALSRIKLVDLYQSS